MSALSPLTVTFFKFEPATGKPVIYHYNPRSNLDFIKEDLQVWINTMLYRYFPDCGYSYELENGESVCVSPSEAKLFFIL